MPIKTEINTNKLKIHKQTRISEGCKVQSFRKMKYSTITRLEHIPKANHMPVQIQNITKMFKVLSEKLQYIQECFKNGNEVTTLVSQD